MLRTASRASIGTLGPLLLISMIAAMFSMFSPEGLAGLRDYQAEHNFIIGWLFLTIALAVKLGAVLLILAGLLVPLLISYLASRLARRLLAPTANDVLDAEEARPILFLRNFAEDRLTLPATWSRRGVLERLTPLRRRRFEELLAASLDIAGPVVGLSPPGTKLPPLGAARLSLPNDGWRNQIEHWARSAELVVLGATPAELTENYAWELALVQELKVDKPVMLVVPPQRKRLLLLRFEAFLRATWDWTCVLSSAPSGIHVAVWHPDVGWRAFGARTRTDVSYTLAIQQAMAWLGAHARAPIP